MSESEEQAAPETEETAQGTEEGTGDGTSDVGAMPEATTEEPEVYPGGADSIEGPEHGDTPGDPVPRDLDPEDNPAIGEDEVPDEIKQLDDKQQEPDEGTSGEDDTPPEPSA
ncbi:hypothetical protein [Nocardioides sp. Root151]|uniref:hypothetical protein n=1 Tax=Nocardioides sp. Root151 TaxID=1736475 RepID=UPI0007029DE3|nr:hypothetical protein [Nocardioides sp. Root151]KQZ67062.1 hypothetical protein ASD66_18900 [Nocardioides sp. Root151]